MYYYTVYYFTCIFYAVVRQISMLFTDNNDSVFWNSTLLLWWKCSLTSVTFHRSSRTFFMGKCGALPLQNLVTMVNSTMGRGSSPSAGWPVTDTGRMMKIILQQYQGVFSQCWLTCNSHRQTDEENNTVLAGGLVTDTGWLMKRIIQQYQRRLTCNTHHHCQ